MLQSRTEEMYRQDPQLTPEPGDTLTGELHIKTYRWRSDPPEIYWLAREFMELHPNVKIDFDYSVGFYEYKSLSYDQKYQLEKKFYDQVRLELASGEADYILQGAIDRLDYYQMTKSGTLLDLRSYWENDPEIRSEDYFMEVLNAFSVDGKMSVIPYGFNFSGAFLHKAALEEAGVDWSDILTVTSDDVLDWYEQAREFYPDLQLFFTAPGKDTLFPAERFRYMDLESGTASFDSPEFVKFLERTRDVINDDPELDPNREVGFGYGALLDENLRYDVTGKPAPSIVHYRPGVSSSGPTMDENITERGRASFAAVEEMDLYQIANYQQPFEYVAGPFPLVSTDGKLGLSAYSDNFVVPAGCKDPDLAWEFIKYCIGERDDLTFERYGYTTCHYYIDSGIPLNKKNCVKMAEDVPKAVTTSYTPGYAHFDPVDGGEMMKKIEEILQFSPLDVAKYNLDVRDILDEYYKNELTTPEQCAERIQGRTEIWLNE